MSSPLSLDLGKIFIPCRTVLELEILTSLYLATSTYDKIKEIPYTHPTSQDLLQAFNIVDNEVQERIVEYFTDVALEKLKPVVMYERNHHDRMRMGNVKPNIETRKCLFLSLHRLKVKFLIIKNFIELFRYNKEGLKIFMENESEGEVSFFEALKLYYTRKNKQNLEIMLPTEKVSERVKELIKDKKSVTNERLLEMATYEFFQEGANIIKFIMREIKASLFVCNLMFARIDVKYPFNRGKDLDVNEEEFMISNDFLPELLKSIAVSYEEKNYLQLKDLLTAFEF
ncbi:MAG: hypothetical protein EU544_06615, partial [Promethearchaeota archaeon]